MLMIVESMRQVNVSCQVINSQKIITIRIKNIQKSRF